MSDLIRKKAKIVDIRESILVLEFCAHEACSACAAKGMCGTDSQSKLKYIELIDDGLGRTVGDEVSLLISSSIGLKGAFYAYLLPVLVVILVIICLQKIILNDFLVGILAIVAIGVYFVFLWLFRNKIEKQISITIE